ncbi:MAG: cell division protein ZapA [Bacteroidetes bacterium]|nr:cell division protein ZapA [Bacteroidota bacterium]MDA1121688.1 cell division protein ZapA [Bacteroidota bacterium]
MSELSIRIKIGNREYPMKVKTEDEERVRNAGKIINEKIKSYADQFGIDDLQDLLAMVAFDSLIGKMRSEEEIDNDNSAASNKVSQLNSLIGQVI